MEVDLSRQSITDPHTTNVERLHKFLTRERIEEIIYHVDNESCAVQHRDSRILLDMALEYLKVMSCMGAQCDKI
jgi:hypothetical protein